MRKKAQETGPSVKGYSGRIYFAAFIGCSVGSAIAVWAILKSGFLNGLPPAQRIAVLVAAVLFVFAVSISGWRKRLKKPV